MRASLAHRALLGAAATAAMTAMSYGVAEAWWRTDQTNAKGGRSVASSISAAAAPTPSKPDALGATVTLSGFASSAFTHGKGTVQWYEVIRRSADTGQLAASFMCQANDCSESAVPDGTWRYTARGAVGAAWRGPVSSSSSDVVIDTTAPHVVSVVALDGTPTRSSSARWKVTYSESVTGVDTSDFAVVAQGITGTSVTSVSGSGTEYTVIASTGSGDGTVRLDAIDDDTVRDTAVGNALASTGGPDGTTTGDTVTVDRTAPVATVSRVGDELTGASSVHWSLHFSEPVETPLTSSIATAASGGISGASVTGVTRTSSTDFDVEASSGSGEGELSLQLLAGATSDAAGNVSAALEPTATYAIDRTPAAVAAIARAAASPTKAATVSWDVTFTGAVTGVGVADFRAVTTGSATGTITSVSGSGTAYTVTVTGIEGDGSIRLDLVDDGTIRDSLLRPLGGAGASNGDAAGDTFVVDRVAPTVVSITRNGAAATTTSSSTVVFRVTFGEAVDGVRLASFGVTHTGTSSGTSVQSFTRIDDRTFDVSLGTGSTEGTIGLEVVADDQVVDSVGNPLAGAWSTGERFTIDSIAPTVATITRLDASPTGKTTVQWRVTFSEAVTGVAAGRFSLTGTAATGATVTTVSSDPSGLTWTVSAVTSGTDGTLALRLIDDDGITDVVGNGLGGTGIGNGSLTGESYEVDNGMPTASIVSTGDPAADATEAGWNIVLSEPVTGFTIGDLDLITTGITGASLTSLDRIDDTHYVLIASLGSGSGTLRPDLQADAFQDAVGNSNAATTGTTITIDRTAPSLSIAAPSAGGTVRGSFTARGYCTAADGNVTLDFSGSGAPADRAVGCTASVPQGSWITTVSASEGSYTLTASQTDAAGNTSTTDTVAFTVDTTAPRLTSIVRKTPATSLTNAASITWTATFSETVTGLGANDFTLTGATITTLSTTTGTTVDITASTSSDTTLTLALATTPTIDDTTGNTLTNTTPTGTTETYTVDRTAPRLTSIVRKTPTTSLTNAASITWTATFSETVTGLGANDFTLTGATITTLSTTTGTTVDITASTSSDTTLTLALATTPTIDDTAGNTLTNTTPTGTTETYTVDRTAPAVTITSPASGSTKRASVTLSGACTTADGTVTLSVTGSGAPAVASPTCTSSTWSTSATFPSGSYTLTASQTDAADNRASASSSFIVDAVAPRLATIARKTPSTSATNANSVTWTVTFSESVTSVDTTDFAVSGTTSPSVTSVSASSGTTIDVTASTGSGNATLTLALAAAPTIDDAAGNTLTNTTATGTVETYAVDKTAPTVTITSPASGSSLAGSVTIGGACTTGDGNVSVTATGTGAPSISGVSCTSSAWTTTVAFPTGTFSLSASQTDTAGNTGTSGSVSFTADGVAPTASSVTLANGGTSGTADKSDTITVVFSETVKGTTMCSLWTNDTTATAYSYNGNADIMVTMTPVSGGVTVTVSSTSCTLNLGTFTLPAYATGSARTFGGQGSAKSSLSWTPSTRTLVLTLGTGSGGTGATGITSTTGTYNPPTATRITDLAGNQLTASKATSGTF